MPDQASPIKERFAAIRAEARRRIAARNRIIKELVRKVAGNRASASDATASAEASAANNNMFDEFEAGLFEDLADCLDQEDHHRMVTIDELMQIGMRHEEEGSADGSEG